MLKVFDAMRRYKLGQEQASRSLTVARTIDHIVNEKKMPSRVAVSKLSNHLRKVILSGDPYDSSSSNSDDTSLSFASDPTRVRITLPKQNSPTSVRLQPKSSLPSNPVSMVNNSTKSISAANNSVQVKNTSKVETNKRDRSDSASEEVVTKLNEGLAAAVGSKPIASVATPGSRSKRSRAGHLVGEENDPSVNSSNNIAVNPTSMSSTTSKRARK